MNKYCAIHWIEIRVLDSVIRSSKEWAQLFHERWLLQLNFPFMENVLSIPLNTAPRALFRIAKGLVAF